MSDFLEGFDAVYAMKTDDDVLASLRRGEHPKTFHKLPSNIQKWTLKIVHPLQPFAIHPDMMDRAERIEAYESLPYDTQFSIAKTAGMLSEDLVECMGRRVWD